MALPAEVNSAESGFRLGTDGGGDCGPWTHEGRLFGLFIDNANINLEVWYDDGSSRGENFAEADAANHPAVNSVDRYAAGTPVGDTLWIVFADSSSNLVAIPFSFTDLVFGSPITGGPEQNAITGWEDPLAVVAIPGNRLRIFHNGAFGATNGSAQTHFVDLDVIAGTWGTDTVVEDSPDVSGTDCVSAGLLLGSGGLTHAFYVREVSSTGEVQLLHRSISSDGGTLGTEQEILNEPTIGTFQQFIGDRRYDVVGAVVKLAVPYFDNATGSPSRYPLRVFLTDSETDPTWTDESIGAEPVGTADTPSMAACWIGSQLHVAMTAMASADLPHGAGDNDLYRVSDSGSGWGTPVVVVDDASISLDNCRARWIDVGLGMFYVRSLKPWYTEVAIDPCSGGSPVNLIGAAY